MQTTTATNADKALAGGLWLAASNYDKAKAEFEKAYADSPAYAIEWHAEELVRTQTLARLAEYYLPANFEPGIDSPAGVAEPFLADQERRIGYSVGRSTSEASNFTERTAHAATMHLLGDVLEAARRDREEA